MSSVMRDDYARDGATARVTRLRLGGGTREEKTRTQNEQR